MMFMFHFRHIIRWAPLIYAAAVILLICVHFFGKHVGGSTRWLPIGPFSLQPSEPAKLVVIIMLARYYAVHARTSGMTLKDLSCSDSFDRYSFPADRYPAGSGHGRYNSDHRRYHDPFCQN
jgi:hypothetical protein